MSLISRVWDYEKKEWIDFSPAAHAEQNTGPTRRPAQKKQYDVHVRGYVTVEAYVQVEASSEQEALDIVNEDLSINNETSEYWRSPDYEVVWDQPSDLEAVSAEATEE